MNNSFPDPFEMEVEKAMGLSDASPHFVQALRKRVLDHRKAQQWQRPLVWRAAAMLVGFVIVMFLAAGPQKVLAAVQQWLGQYIPGIGFVEDSTALRILEAPATVKTDGAEVTIRWAYAAEDQTVVAYPEGKDSRPCQDWLVYSPETREKIQDISLGTLRLPDGRELGWNFNGGYPPIPANIDDATLVTYTNKNIPNCPEGASCRCMDEDQRMEIPLKFVVPPAGTKLEIYEMQFTPVAPN
ncbi:MAG TPA: hypothetical protein VHO48_03600 [Anaerolineaceae bacterium]|nr:hypothetical protein [Anaerolineaceae bacterium]